MIAARLAVVNNNGDVVPVGVFDGRRNGVGLVGGYDNEVDTTVYKLVDLFNLSGIAST